MSLSVSCNVRTHAVTPAHTHRLQGSRLVARWRGSDTTRHDNVQIQQSDPCFRALFSLPRPPFLPGCPLSRLINSLESMASHAVAQDGAGEWLNEEPPHTYTHSQPSCCPRLPTPWSSLPISSHTHTTLKPLPCSPAMGPDNKCGRSKDDRRAVYLDSVLRPACRLLGEVSDDELSAFYGKVARRKNKKKKRKPGWHGLTYLYWHLLRSSA